MQPTTSNFKTDDQAREYIEEEQRTFFGKIPSKDIWMHILSNNPELSIQDISRMCSVNTEFKKLCDDGLIWKRIFVRQFGRDEFEAVNTELNFATPLMRLMVWRIWKTVEHLYDSVPVTTLLTMNKKNGLTFIYSNRRKFDKARITFFDTSAGQILQPPDMTVQNFEKLFFSNDKIDT